MGKLSYLEGAPRDRFDGCAQLRRLLHTVRELLQVLDKQLRNKKYRFFKLVVTDVERIMERQPPKDKHKAAEASSSTSSEGQQGEVAVPLE